MAVASNMFNKLAKLFARPSCGVADNIIKVSERVDNKRAKRAR